MWFSSMMPSWVSSWLRYWGLMDKKGKMVFLGLDNAGKTTLMGLLANGELKYYTPTMLPTSEHFTMGGVKFTAFDLGGHVQARRVWSDYCMAMDGLVFMVDTSDRYRMEEAGRELRALLEDPSMENIPVAILGNKIDRRDALGETDLMAALGIYKYLSTKNTVKLFLVSVVKRQGIKEAVQWLATFLD